MAWMTWAAIRGLSSWLSREAGPPPLTSSPARMPFSAMNTVRPVPAWAFSVWPIRMPPMSVTGISRMAVPPSENADTLNMNVAARSRVKTRLKVSVMLPPNINPDMYFRR